MKKKVRDIIIIISILLCLIIIYITKYNINKKYSYKKGFELYVNQDFDIKKDANSGYPLLLELGSESCAPCREMMPTLKILNKSLQGKAKIKFLDVIKYKNISDQFNFHILPTQIFFDGKGNIYYGHEGIISRKDILKIFKEMGYNFD